MRLARFVVTSLLVSSACATVPPAHMDPARDPANPKAREAPLVVGGQLPGPDDPTLRVGKPPFETGESGTKPGSTGGHHHGGGNPEEKPAAPMGHERHDMPAPAAPKKPPPPDHAGHEMHDQKQEAIYTCPMHPEVRSKTPGKCPKCGMTLVPEEKK
jgi:hypothetical protein